MDPVIVLQSPASGCGCGQQGPHYPEISAGGIAGGAGVRAGRAGVGYLQSPPQETEALGRV
eukprot:COSAG01_NODE_72859_length_251_cov_17.184211_1_plen_60_part_10